MPTASAQPAAVLDYAPPAPQDTVARRLRAVLTILACMLLGALAGWIIDPQLYRAVGFLQIEQTTQPHTANEQLLDVDAVQSRQSAIVAALTSPNNLNLTVTRLPPTITLTPAEIAPRLKVQVVPESRLISVSFDDPDPRTAAAVANAVMGQRSPPGVTVVAVATPPAKPQQNRLYFVGGSAVGLLLGIAIVALRWK